MKTTLFKAMNAADVLTIGDYGVENFAEMGDIVLVTISDDDESLIEFEDQEIEIDEDGDAFAMDVDDNRRLIEFRIILPLTLAHIEARLEA